MPSRRALLIGVPTYKPPISSLDFVRDDVAKLKEALASSGYSVDTVGVDGEEAGLNTVRASIDDFLLSANSDETLLVTFSGHGMHYQGQDYLIPADAVLTRDDRITTYSLAVDFSRPLEESKAAAVFFFIDACREGVSPGTMGEVGMMGWTEGKRERVSQKLHAYVFACGPGQVSRFVQGDEAFSVFSRALADTMHVSASAVTFQEVTRQLGRRLDELVDEHGMKRQQVTVRTESDGGRLNAVAISSTDASARRREGWDLDAIADITITEDDLVLLSRDLDGQAPWIEEVSPAHLMRAGHGLGQALGVVLRRLRRLEPVGIGLPEADADALAGVEVEDADLLVLSHNLDERDPWIEEVSPLHMLRAAHRLREPVGTVLDRFRRLEPAGLRLPEVDAQALAALEVEDADLLVLSRDLDSAEPWIEEVSPIHLLRAANMLGEPVGAALDRVRRLAPAGVRVPDLDLGTLAALEVEDADLLVLSHDLDSVGLWIEEVSPLHLLRAAHRLQEPLGAVVARVRRFAALGLPQPDIEPEAVADMTVSDEDAVVLDLLSAPTGLPRAAGRLQEPVGAVLRRLERFSRAGLAVPEIDPQDVADLTVDAHDVLLLSRDFDGLDPWLEGDASSLHVLRACHRLEMPVDEALQRLRRFEPFGIGAPDLDPEGVADLTVSDADATALEFFTETMSQVSLTRLDLLRAANALGEPVGTLLERLSRFAPLGLWMPDVDPEEVSDLTVGDADATALELFEDGLSHASLNRVGLLRTANRLRESVGTTLERLRRFDRLGVRPPAIAAAEVMDLVVEDEDLRLLSEDLDAISPWLDDWVSPIHIARVAHEFSESVGAAVDRLSLLADVGIAFPPIDRDAVTDLRIEHDDLVLLSTDLDGRSPWIDGGVTAVQILRGAAELGTDAGDVITRLRRLEPAGLQLPEVDQEAAANVGAEDTDLLILSEGLDGEPPWVEDHISPEHVLRASKAFDESVGTILERLRRLRPVGIRLPGDRGARS